MVPAHHGYADRLHDGLDGLDWPERAKRLQRQWIGDGADGTIRLHDWLISRQRYWGPPIPIVHCDVVRCRSPCPTTDLPVVLPDVDDFRPTGTGRSPLAAGEDWVQHVCPRCGGPADARPTSATRSSTRRGTSCATRRPTSTTVRGTPSGPSAFLPVDFYAGGPEHVQRHHLYARFVTMALHDLGLVPFEEPFPRVRLGGLIAKDGAKMSKSRGNVVTPDDYIDRHGADVLRCALLFAAPWEQGGEFSDDAIVGIERFFARVWRAVTGPDRDTARCGRPLGGDRCCRERRSNGCRSTSRWPG